MRTFLKRQVNDFNIFFCFLNNTVFLKQGFLWTKHKIHTTLFYSQYNSKRSGSFVIKFFNSSHGFWGLFWKILTFNRNLVSGFFVELELIGLGFRVKKIASTVYRFFWGYATLVYLFVPADLLVEYAAEERVIFFFGVNASVVNGFSSYLMLLKRLSSYRVTGFVRPGKIIRLNSGKQR